jgi:hypothetical protein
LIAVSAVTAAGFSLVAAPAGDAARVHTSSDGRSAPTKLSTDAARTAGVQQWTSAGGMRVREVDIRGAVYVSGNQRGWVNGEQVPSGIARFLRDLAVNVPPSSSVYKYTADGLTLNSALDELKLSGHLTEGAPVTLRGRRVIPITGGQPPAAGGGKGRMTVYVTGAKHPMPVFQRSRFTLRGERGAFTVALSRWGEHVAPSRPENSISIDALPAVTAAAEGTALTHYGSFTGPHGYEPPARQPWAEGQCRPIRLDASDVPAWVYTQIGRVVAEARTDGLDVTLDRRNGSWNAGSLYYRDGQSAKSAAVVPIEATEAKPRPGQRHIEVGWDTRLSRDKHHEQFTEVNGTLWLKVIAGQRVSLRRAIRQLIAMSQGVGGTDLHGSGIANFSSHDEFTLPDIAAMLQMSGCVKKAPISSLVTHGKVTTPTKNGAGQPLKFPGS